MSLKALDRIATTGLLNASMNVFSSSTSEWVKVDYSKTALKEDLSRIHEIWIDVQSSRDRNAIYRYLSSVFNLVRWWSIEQKAIERAEQSLGICGISAPTPIDPFAAVIVATISPEKLDRRLLSKWSRTMRFAAAYKPRQERLKQFIKRMGGINACASEYGRRLGRHRSRPSYSD